MGSFFVARAVFQTGHSNGAFEFWVAVWRIGGSQSYFGHYRQTPFLLLTEASRENQVASWYLGQKLVCVIFLGDSVWRIVDQISSIRLCLLVDGIEVSQGFRSVLRSRVREWNIYIFSVFSGWILCDWNREKVFEKIKLPAYLIEFIGVVFTGRISKM